jgi:hypothetical protein
MNFMKMRLDGSRFDSCVQTNGRLGEFNSDFSGLRKRLMKKEENLQTSTYFQ